MTDLEIRQPVAVEVYVEDPFDAAIRAWLSAQPSPHTRRSYEKAIEQWQAFLEDTDVVLADNQTGTYYRGPRRHHADAWRNALVDGSAPGLGSERIPAKPLAAKSVDSRLVAVRSFYDYLVSEEAIPANPIRGAKLLNRGPEHQTQALSPEELRALTDAAYATEAALPRLLVLLLSTTGCRISEALGLRVEDIGRSQGFPVITLTRKGGFRQTISIDSPVHEHLLRWAEGMSRDVPIFTRGGKVLSYSGARFLLDQIGRRARLVDETRPTVHPHMLRATLITVLLNKGWSIEEVQEYVGHAKTETTLGYHRGRGQLDKQARLAAEMGSIVGSSRGLAA